MDQLLSSHYILYSNDKEGGDARMSLVVSLTSEKNEVRYCNTLPVIPRGREIDRVEFPERAPGPNICGGAIRAAEAHIALPAKRVKQDATKGEPCAVSQDFRSALSEKVNVVTHRIPVCVMD